MSEVLPCDTELIHFKTIQSFNYLLNNKFFDWFKLKVFADDKVNVATMIISFIDR